MIPKILLPQQPQGNGVYSAIHQLLFFINLIVAVCVVGGSAIMLSMNGSSLIPERAWAMLGIGLAINLGTYAYTMAKPPKSRELWMAGYMGFVGLLIAIVFLVTGRWIFCPLFSELCQ